MTSFKATNTVQHAIDAQLVADLDALITRIEMLPVLVDGADQQIPQGLMERLDVLLQRLTALPGVIDAVGERIHAKLVTSADVWVATVNQTLGLFAARTAELRTTMEAAVAASSADASAPRLSASPAAPPLPVSPRVQAPQRDRDWRWPSVLVLAGVLLGVGLAFGYAMLLPPPPVQEPVVQSQPAPTTPSAKPARPQRQPG